MYTYITVYMCICIYIEREMYSYIHIYYTYIQFVVWWIVPAAVSPNRAPVDRVHPRQAETA